MLKNIILSLALVLMFLIVFRVALTSIDKITARECARGITNACKYINND